MTTEFNELLSVSPEDKAQVWIIGSRDQVAHLINEFYVRKIASDRVQFTPIVPVPFAAGKYMSVLVR
jgi:alkanesulfonate monooxygenase SsuD/methylene tetrahydromethanopterin reductase-like flavin-dependent oxidoreductase (luciferase family)